MLGFIVKLRWIIELLWFQFRAEPIWIFDAAAVFAVDCEIELRFLIPFWYHVKFKWKNKKRNREIGYDEIAFAVYWFLFTHVLTWCIYTQVLTVIFYLRKKFSNSNFLTISLIQLFYSSRGIHNSWILEFSRLTSNSLLKK